MAVMKKYTHLLIDADHTIFDFGKSQEASLQMAFRDMNMEYKQEFGQAYDVINKAMWLAFERGEVNRAELQNRRASELQKAVGFAFDPDQFHDLYKGHLSKQVHYYENARETVEDLANHYSLAMITNGLAPIQRSRLALSGILHLFDEVTISGEINKAKPDPAYFDHTFNALNNPKRSNALVIGDNLLADIHGGNQAGCDTCWINNSNMQVKEKVEPTYIVDDWNDIANLLLNT